MPSDAERDLTTWRATVDAALARYQQTNDPLDECAYGSRVRSFEQMFGMTYLGSTVHLGDVRQALALPMTVTGGSPMADLDERAGALQATRRAIVQLDEAARQLERVPGQERAREIAGKVLAAARALERMLQ